MTTNKQLLQNAQAILDKNLSNLFSGLQIGNKSKSKQKNVSKCMADSQILKTYVQTMRNKNNNKKKCQNEKDLLKKCILCKQYLSSNEYGPELENYLKQHLKINKAIDCVSGDGCKNNKNIEIKVSLGDNKGKLNYVQIRPDHNIDFYIFLAYNLLEDELGNVYLMLVPSEKVYELIPTYGGYAHGTVDVLGEITSQNIFGRNCEYALRPNPNNNNNTKPKKLWNELIKYKVQLSEEMFNYN
jgi:hypothetical protein